MGLLKTSFTAAGTLSVLLSISSCDVLEEHAGLLDFSGDPLTISLDTSDIEILSQIALAPKEFVQAFDNFTKAGSLIDHYYVQEVDWSGITRDIIQYHDKRFGLDAEFTNNAEQLINNMEALDSSFLRGYAPLMIDISYQAYLSQRLDPETGQLRFDADDFSAKATQLMFDNLDKYTGFKTIAEQSAGAEDTPPLPPLVEDYMIDGNIGYIKLRDFDSNAPEPFRHALLRLFINGATSYVFDLRGNPGGYITAANEIADMFLDDGVIIKQSGKQIDKTVFASLGDETDGAPLVVLVDENSASASEIVSMALKENDRAIIIGQTTYGKGTAHTYYSLNENNAVQITQSYFYGPDSNSIQNIGLAPDIWVSEDGAAYAPETANRQHSKLDNPKKLEFYPDPPDSSCGSTLGTRMNEDGVLEISNEQIHNDLALQCAVDYLKGEHVTTRLTAINHSYQDRKPDQNMNAEGLEISFNHSSP